MNFDIRLAVGFWQHPKVHRLEKALGLRGVRSLQILWCWCAQNRPTGQLCGLDAEDIEFVADWRGKKGAFFEQCLGAWIDEVEGVFVLHEWQEHNPWQAAAGERTDELKEKRRKAAMSRWAKDTVNGQEAASPAAPEMQNHANAMQNQILHDANGMQNGDLHDANDMQNQDLHMQNSNLHDANAMLPIPIPDIKNININTAFSGCDAPASADAAASPAGAAEYPLSAQKPKSRKQKGRPPDEPYYQAKSGRYLTGKRLAAFSRFWKDFDFPKGKAEAADAWLDIAPMTDSLVDRICDAAKQEAAARSKLEAKGQTPKWPQGWLSGRRWEDYAPQENPQPAAPVYHARDTITEAEREKAKETQRRLEAERKAKKGFYGPEKADPGEFLAQCRENPSGVAV